MIDTTNAADSPRMWRWISGLGIVYAVLYLTAFIVLSGNDPSISASPAAVVSHYAAHQGSGEAGVFAVVLASIAFAFFAGALRQRITTATANARHLSSVLTTGAAVYTSGLLLLAMTRIALLDAAHHHQPGVAQVLNYLDSDNFFPMIAGLAIFMLSAGIAIVRTSALPTWLGWFAVGVGVIATAGPLGQIAVFLAPLWMVVASIVLIIRPEMPPGRVPSVTVAVEPALP